MSCNGCRVLRKGCSESCTLRPCLQWIESADAQGHATVFVAKFFGRSGLMGFIGSVPPAQRPALFQSLLYEACGRTVNPIFGAVGLLFSGNWKICQVAVETVLRGGTLRPITTPAPDGNLTFPSLPAPLIPAGSTLPEKFAHSDGSSIPQSEESVEGLHKARLMDGLRGGTAMAFQTKICSLPSAVANQFVSDDSRVQGVKQEYEVNSTHFQYQEWNQIQQNFPDVNAYLTLKSEVIGRGKGTGLPQRRNGEEREFTSPIAPVARRVSAFEYIAGPKEKLELDLTLSSSGNKLLKVSSKRKMSPNTSESVNSEGSVTSLDESNYDLSLKQWKLKLAGPPIEDTKRRPFTLFGSP